VPVTKNEQDGVNHDTPQLFDVLTFLCMEKRTGKLHVSMEEKSGEVFIVDGKITHAQYEQCAGLQALYFMLAWEQGKYNFTPKDTIDKTTIEMEGDKILSLLAQRQQEWQRINQDCPLNRNAVLFLLPEARGTIRLKKEEWDILARIDGRRSLQEISDELYMAPLDLVKIIYRFHEAGLIGKGTRYPEMAYTAFGEEFLSSIEREFSLAVGPLAPMLLAEALQDLEETPEPLTSDKIEMLLEKLTTIIPVEENRLRFQQAARILVFEFSDDDTLSPTEEKNQGITSRSNGGEDNGSA
jgi:DNA-binding MarR family transcriptional regulator